MASIFMMSGSERTVTCTDKIIAGVLYAFTSTSIMLVNKHLLTEYDFPSFTFLFLLQSVASVVVLSVCRSLGYIHFPYYSRDILRLIGPVPLMFFANTLSGLGATQKITMPMFVLLRRFSIVMTMILEMYMLRKTFASEVHMSVGLMVLGALIAAHNDFQTTNVGYAMILLNDVFTALQGVVLRKKMDEKTALGAHGVMYYSNLFAIPLTLCLMVLRPSTEVVAVFHFSQWGNVKFLGCLLASAVMGFAINFSYFLCTKYNSPLTTTVIGAGKNIFTSYVGMLFRDYQYSHLGFVGLNVSVFGSILYSFAEVKKVVRARKSGADDHAASGKSLEIQSGGRCGCRRGNARGGIDGGGNDDDSNRNMGCGIGPSGEEKFKIDEPITISTSGGGQILGGKSPPPQPVSTTATTSVSDSVAVSSVVPVTVTTAHYRGVVGGSGGGAAFV